MRAAFAGQVWQERRHTCRLRTFGQRHDVPSANAQLACQPRNGSRPVQHGRHLIPTPRHSMRKGMDVFRWVRMIGIARNEQLPRCAKRDEPASRFRRTQRHCPCRRIAATGHNGNTCGQPGLCSRNSCDLTHHFMPIGKPWQPAGIGVAGLGHHMAPIARRLIQPQCPRRIRPIRGKLTM